METARWGQYELELIAESAAFAAAVVFGKAHLFLISGSSGVLQVVEFILLEDADHKTLIIPYLHGLGGGTPLIS